MVRIHIFKAEKLVRDKTKERLSARKIVMVDRVVQEDEYVPLLKKKLLEEAQEVADARTTQEYLAEFADVLEVILALAQVVNITVEQIEQKRLQLREARGGFDKRAYCVSFKVGADNREGVEYFQCRPAHYPEIDQE